MRILFITDPDKNLRKAGCVNDYMRDLVYFGISENDATWLVASKQIPCLYRSQRDAVRKDHLWGRGFTTCWLLDEMPPPENDVAGKIADRHYDAIIYGNIWICDDYYELASRAYPANRIAIIDGIDSPKLHPAHERHLYYKRELSLREPLPPNIRPISFAMPTSRIQPPHKPVQKSQLFATCVPGNKSTYVFTDESQYYEDYRRSIFAFTTQKHGWDCMRHYEIIANRCIPLFFNLTACPALTMTTFPKQLCLEATNLFAHFNESNYRALESQLFDHLLKHNTSRALGSRLIHELTAWFFS